mgnify:CR=1 FL=1
MLGIVTSVLNAVVSATGVVFLAEYCLLKTPLASLSPVIVGIVPCSTPLDAYL